MFNSLKGPSMVALLHFSLQNLPLYSSLAQSLLLLFRWEDFKNFNMQVAIRDEKDTWNVRVKWQIYNPSLHLASQTNCTNCWLQSTSTLNHKILSSRRWDSDAATQAFVMSHPRWQGTASCSSPPGLIIPHKSPTKSKQHSKPTQPCKTHIDTHTFAHRATHSHSRAGCSNTPSRVLSFDVSVGKLRGMVLVGEGERDEGGDAEWEVGGDW